MNQNEPIIDQIVSIIVSTVDPDQIMLFGSYARGDFTEKSDVDVLILKKGMIKKRELIKKLHRAFFDFKLDKAVDVLALDSDRYNEIKNCLGFIYKTIKEEGKLIYDRL